uniref:Uncharacterized protein n=1 Tax=Tanacetum cinerariifolium TaxID=118510 RepID=A0A699Q0Y7_TANCI|nr:hypothetical protein [Tanacetum cinerariifolium]
MRIRGTGYKKIHVCSNNWILYWKDNNKLTVCPTCEISRWKVDNKTYKVYDATRRITDGVLRHPADLHAWRPRNLRLGISADGVDVNSGTRHHKPLVDDLHTLVETGADTYDASTKENFNLRAILLWTINDYIALGTLNGCPYSGFKGCVVYGKDTHCVRLSALSKQSYAGHRRYLPYNHLFGRQKNVFNRKQEF